MSFGCWGNARYNITLRFGLLSNAINQFNFVVMILLPSKARKIESSVLVPVSESSSGSLYESSAYWNWLYKQKGWIGESIVDRHRGQGILKARRLEAGLSKMVKWIMSSRLLKDQSLSEIPHLKQIIKALDF